jgi:signal peptidase I
VSVEQQNRETPRSYQGEARALTARPRSRGVSRLVELPLLVLAAFALSLVVRANVGQAFHIPSGSMEPQLQVGDRVLVSRTSYRLHDVHRGDIVVFPKPSAAHEDEGLPARVVNDLLESVALRTRDDILIKRIVGLPGETIRAQDGHVVIDGRTLLEPYLPDGLATEDFDPVEIPDGHVFVMGDNRNPGGSQDSRVIGTIEIDSIEGRAIARIWPPDRTAFL